MSTQSTASAANALSKPFTLAASGLTAVFSADVKTHAGSRGGITMKFGQLRDFPSDSADNCPQYFESDQAHVYCDTQTSGFMLGLDTMGSSDIGLGAEVPLVMWVSEKERGSREAEAFVWTEDKEKTARGEPSLSLFRSGKQKLVVKARPATGNPSASAIPTPSQLMGFFTLANRKVDEDLVELGKGDTIYDVGAADGSWSAEVMMPYCSGAFATAGSGVDPTSMGMTFNASSELGIPARRLLAVVQMPR